ncbi:hypothetical protein SK069_05740 [Patulibacter brassicae]|uniref:SGNH hydrolase-type esterase domain-containing protein n=1 Tax=Patulibacter brassicae TaxID=1705717 RepID=A0ABU4VH07_9ACTN|nr:hypothetical protein [Patulibacter brassicae]MDX8151086.1 hypothetical protein [Patulibacter brassicae]
MATDLPPFGWRNKDDGPPNTPLNKNNLEEARRTAAEWAVSAARVVNEAPVRPDALYGAAYDGTGDQVTAINAALQLAATANTGGEVLLRRGAWRLGAGTLAIPNGVDLRGESLGGTRILVPADRTSDDYAVTIAGGDRRGGLRDLTLQGPGPTAVTPGSAGAAMNGAWIGDNGIVDRVRVERFRAGLTIVGNHQKVLGGTVSTNNHINLYWGPNGTSFGDQLVSGVELTGAALASIAVHPTNTIDSATLHATHLGWAPYGLLRLAGTGKSFVTSTTFDDVPIEQIGNGFIYDEDRATGGHDIRANVWTGASGGTWNSSRRDAARPWDYGIDVGPFYDLILDIGYLGFWEPGNLGCIRAQSWTASEVRQAANVIPRILATSKPLIAASTFVRGVTFHAEAGRRYRAAKVSGGAVQRYDLLHQGSGGDNVWKPPAASGFVPVGVAAHDAANNTFVLVAEGGEHPVKYAGTAPAVGTSVRASATTPGAVARAVDESSSPAVGVTTENPDTTNGRAMVRFTGLGAPGGGAPSTASPAVLGVAKLSADAADPANPVVVTPRTLQQLAVSRIFFAGHSGMEGYGLTPKAARFASKLSAALHAEEVTVGKTGACIAIDDSPTLDGSWVFQGGWATVWHSLRPWRYDGVNRAMRQEPPYIPLAPVCVFFYGGNDLGYVSSSIANTNKLILEAERSCVARARSGALFPATDATVTYSGTWSTEYQVGYGTDNSLRRSTSVGAGASIAVPSTFPGGDIDVFLVIRGQSGACDVAVDGAAHGTWDGRSTGRGIGTIHGATRATGSVYRITGLAPGAHTVTLTVTALGSGGSVDFDSWSIAAPEPPLVLLMEHPVFPGLPATQVGGLYSPVTASDIAAMNNVHRALAAEYSDGSVRSVSFDAALAAAGAAGASTTPKSAFTSDGSHPNERGHAIVAQRLLEEIAAAPPRTLGLANQQAHGLVWRPIRATGSGQLDQGDPLFAANYGPAGFAGTSGGAAAKTRDGMVVLRGIVKRGSSGGSADEPMFTLPIGMRPAAQLSPTTNVTSPTGVPAAVSALRIDTDGSVRWRSGTNTNGIVLDGVTFPADG